MMIKIRNYQEADYTAVVSILKEADLFDEVWDSEDNLSGMISNDEESIIVAEIENQVVGNIFIIPYGTKVSYLFRLAVRKEFRKQGIATELIKRAKEISKSRGVSEIGLYVDAKDMELQSFYKKRNFKMSENAYYYMWSGEDLN